MLALAVTVLLATSPSVPAQSPKAEKLQRDRRPATKRGVKADAKPEAAESPAPFKWELPGEVVHEIEVPETFQSNGVPNRFHVVRVELPWQAVHAHFFRSFERQGLYIPPAKHQMELNGQAMLTAFDPVRKISYSVILQPHANKQTTVIMGEAYLGQARPPGAPDFVPLPPNAQNVFTTHQESASTVAFSVEASPEDVRRFYVETLTETGYVQEPDGSFRKGSRALSFAASTRKDGPGSAVSLMVRQVGGEGGPPKR